MLEYILFVLAAGATGLARAGLAAIGNISTPALSYIFSGRQAAGVTIILLLAGDIGAIIYYHKRMNVKVLTKVMPLSLLGMGIGIFIGGVISNKIYMTILAIISGIALWVLIFTTIQRIKLAKINQEPHQGLAHVLILYSCGILAGIGTMLGNGASMFMNLFLLELNFKKEEFISTLAWYFFMINILKFLVHMYWWHSLDWNMVLIPLKVVVFVYIGFFIGLFFVRRMTERWFRGLILFSSIMSFVLLVVRVMFLI